MPMKFQIEESTACSHVSTLDKISGKEEISLNSTCQFSYLGNKPLVWMDNLCECYVHL